MRSHPVRRAVAARVLVLPLLSPEGLRRLEARSNLPYAFTRPELEMVVQGVRAAGFRPELLGAEPLPPESFNPSRRQYQCTPILYKARERLKQDGDPTSRILVLTDGDIYEPGMSFTGGMAELGGRSCLVSLARLQSGDRERLVRRAVKESLHELGHNLALEHCRDRSCVMLLSRAVADSDLKDAAFCPKCRVLLGRALR